MTLAATGRRVVAALGIEEDYNRGSNAPLAYDPVLPSNIRQMTPKRAVPSVTRSGWVPAGTPGTREGSADLTAVLSIPLLLRMAYHLYGGVTKTSPAAGVHHYAFEPEVDAFHETSFGGFAGLPPVELGQVMGVLFAQMQVASSDDTAMLLALTGQPSRVTRLSPALPDAGNTGASIPRIRGGLADPTAGSVYLQITRDVIGGGVQFNLEQTTGTPTFPGAAQDAYLVGTDAEWQAGLGADGRDLGPMTKDTDPFEIHLGTAAELGGYSVGDSFEIQIPGSWTTPALVEAPTARTWTLHQLHVLVRDAGSTDPRQPIQRQSIDTTFACGMEPRNTGPGAYNRLYRTGDFGQTLQLVRPFVDTWWRDREGAFVDLEAKWIGATIGTSGLREQWGWEIPYAEIASTSAPASQPGLVDETIELVAREDDLGNPPSRLVVQTAYDWTLPTP